MALFSDRNLRYRRTVSIAAGREGGGWVDETYIPSFASSWWDLHVIISSQRTLIWLYIEVQLYQKI